MRKYIHIFLFVIFFVPSGLCPAQSSWNRTYGGVNEDGGLSVIETPDSGYMVVGYTGSFGNGASDAYILRTDSVGQFLWYKTYGGANVDIAKKIIPFGGGYVVAGYSNSGTFDYDFWILRLDDMGDTLWTGKVGGNDWDRAYSAAAVSANAFVVVGQTYSGDNQFEDGYIVKMDDLGDTLWTRKFSLPGNESFKDVVKVSDTRYAAVGTTENPVSQQADGLLLFFDADGNFLDTVYYDYNHSEYLNTLAIDPVSYEMMLGGYYYYDTTHFPKSIQIKVDSLGGVIFPLLAPTADDFGMHILSYGHYSGDIFFFCGRSYYKNSGDHQAVVLKSWPDGYPEWLRSYGTIGPDDGVDAVIKTFDDGFLSVGFTKSYGPGTQALLMMKLSADATLNTGTMVSIKENAQKEGIRVFPNPADEQVTFSAAYDFTLRLYDANGRLMQLPGQSPANQYVVNIAHLPAGYYFGEMTFADGSRHFEKILIQSR